MGYRFALPKQQHAERRQDHRGSSKPSVSLATRGALPFRALEGGSRVCWGARATAEAGFPVR